MNIYYLSSSGRRLELDKPPYHIDESQLFDFKWSLSFAQKPLGDGGRLLSRRRGSYEKTIKLYIYADSEEEFHKGAENLYTVTDADIHAMSHGRLYVGEEYITCFITASKKEIDKNWRTCASVTLTVMPENPCWQLERRFTFTADDGEGDGMGFKYPSKYPKSYTLSAKSAVIINNHYAESPMVITIYGPTSSPVFSLDGCVMGLDRTIGDGEYAVINQIDRTITLVTQRGERINIFDSRIKNGNIFKYAPSGASLLECDGGLVMDMTVVRQRSEPQWS